MRLITLNGVKLFVYLNGMILRYSDKGGKHLIKGWSEAKGSIYNGYISIFLNGKKILKHRIVGYSFLGLDIDNPKQQIDHIDRNKLNNNMNICELLQVKKICLIEMRKDIIKKVKSIKRILKLTIKQYI